MKAVTEYSNGGGDTYSLYGYDDLFHGDHVWVGFVVSFHFVDTVYNQIAILLIKSCTMAMSLQFWKYSNEFHYNISIIKLKSPRKLNYIKNK